jgi:hypothetical protein
VAGRVSRRARGVVRVRLDSGRGSRTYAARIRRGRWRVAEPVALGAGYLTIQFTGYRAAPGGPMRGEQDGVAVGAPVSGGTPASAGR